MPHRTQRRARSSSMAIISIAALSLVASACGGGDNDTPGGGEQAGGGAAEASYLRECGTPRPGGTLRYGLEGGTTGLNPTSDRWAISSTMVGLAVYDPLFAFDEDSQPKPYLAESATPNANFTEWEITLREGVTFSDGTPLEADALKVLYERHQGSLLTRGSVTALDTIEVKDARTATFKMKQPWASFPASLTSQLGVVPAVSVYDGDGRTNVIGTGPFKVDRAEGDDWKLVRNERYWRKDAQGNAMPYLAGVEFRALPDEQARANALRSGDLDIIHVSDATNIKQFRRLGADGSFQVLEDTGESEENFIIINTSKAPLSDPTLRRALAFATDKQAYNDTINEGVLKLANGPFDESSPWYVETDYPSFDPDEARKLVSDWKAANGGQAPSFTLRQSLGAQANRQLALLQQMWNDVGFDVKIETQEQQKQILDAVGGNYDANIWRQFGSPDPDQQYLWWTSKNAEGGLALNIARNKNPRIDEALDAGRATRDPAARKEAYATIQREFAKDIPYIWLTHTRWMVAAANKVRCIPNGALPDGSPSLPIGGGGDFGGVHRVTQIYLEQ